MAKKRSGKASSRKSKSQGPHKHGKQDRPPKKPPGPKQRSCDVDESSNAKNKTDEGSNRKPESQPSEDATESRATKPLLLLIAAFLGLAGLLVPWEKTWFGAVLGHPSKHAPWLDSPAMLAALPLVGLFAFLAAAFLAWVHLKQNHRRTEGPEPKAESVGQWALGVAALVGLALTAYYNESLNLSPFAGIRDHLWGIPLVALASLAGGALVTWNQDRADAAILAHLATWSSALLLVSALVPVYEFGDRYIPLAAALIRLGRGGAQSFAGLAALVTWASAGLALWFGLAALRRIEAEQERDQTAKGEKNKQKQKQKQKKGRQAAKEAERRSRNQGHSGNLGPLGRLAPVLGWALLLAGPLAALAAALTGQTGHAWFLGPVPSGADQTHHLSVSTGVGLALLTASWSLALGWASPRLAAGWTASLEERRVRHEARRQREEQPKHKQQQEQKDTDGKASTNALSRAQGDAGRHWTDRPVTPVLFWTTAGLMIAAFLILELQALGFTVTDENIYYYQAMLVAQGKMPYRDFFFAHPPLHILIPALLFKIFGFHLVLAKAISILAGLGAGLMVLLTARRLGGDLLALVAMGLYLFSFAILNAAINLTGMNLTVFFLMTGVFLTISGRPGWGGLAAGAAMSTGFYSAAAAAMLLLSAFLRSSGFGLRFAIGLFGMWGGVNLFFWAMGGSAFLDGVYRYHGRKLPQDPRHMFYSDSPVKALFYNIYVLLTGKEFKKTMFYHAHLFAPWAVAALAWVGMRMKRLSAAWSGSGPAPIKPLPRWVSGSLKRLHLTRTGRNGPTNPEAGPTRGHLGWASAFGRWLWADGGLAVLWLTALALLVEFSMFRRLYSFYFVLWYPFMALAAAWLLVSLLRNLAKAKTGAAVLFVGALLWLASLHPALANWGGSVHKGELKRRGQRIDYPWRKAGAFKAATPLVKALFWRGYRLRAQPAEGIRQFLWNKKRHFDEAPEIAKYIHDTTTRDQTIAGASAVAPLLAILAHRPIAAEIVDTNTNRFRAGLLTEEDFYRRICNTKLAYLVSAPMSFFSWRKMRFAPRFLERFTLDRTFFAKSVRFRGTFPVRLLKNVTEATQPPYCRFLGTGNVPVTHRRRRRRR